MKERCITWTILALAGLLTLGATSRASDEDSSRFFFLDLGAFAALSPQALPDNPSAFVRIRPGFSMGSGLAFEPSLAVLFPWRTNVDGGTLVLTSLIDLDVTYRLLPFLSLRAGPGLMWTAYFSSGDVVYLNNGGPDKSPFFVPDGMANSLELTLQGGIELRLHRVVSVNLEVLAPEPFNQARRTVQGLLSVGLLL